MAIQFDNTNTGAVTLRPGTASDAIILGGSSNTVSSQFGATIGGSGNISSSSNSSVVIGGNSCTASGNISVVMGGQNNTANSANSIVSGGYGITRSIIGNAVFSSHDGAVAFSNGASQSGLLIIGRQTTDATPTVLRCNTSAAGTTNQVILPNNSAYYFRGSITAGVTGGGNSAMWSFEGGIKRGANAAATTLIQSVINPVAADAGASSWIVALSADTTNGGLAVTVTGQASTTIRWVCKIETTEMTF
jgi:hypothetical protein